SNLATPFGKKRVIINDIIAPILTIRTTYFSKHTGSTMPIKESMVALQKDSANANGSVYQYSQNPTNGREDAAISAPPTTNTIKANEQLFINKFRYRDIWHTPKRWCFINSNLII
ncbi:MAG TPA: hypothetical protein PLD88_15185, partial [Candidatus Berkiella sp.]|nr:hypothetical protein [Candidatus Berkiella sp.]